MRIAPRPRIVAGLALAALVAAPATAGSLGRTYTANLDPLSAGSHTVGDVTYTIPTTRGTATVNLKGDDVTVTVMVMA